MEGRKERVWIWIWKGRSSNILLVLCIMIVMIAKAKGSSADSETCILSKFLTTCRTSDDCFTYGERHLYCNKTAGANKCAFRIETYAGQAESDKDCPGPTYSAEPWSNPVDPATLGESSAGVDCMRLCLMTESCFGVVIQASKCYLKNDLCFNNLVPSQGSILGVMAVVREDYRCGCHFPFTRKRADGERLEWIADCPESQLDRNPYRCCSKKGLCTRCGQGQEPGGEEVMQSVLTKGGNGVQVKRWYRS